jgi:Trk K+ transport system NAD-binding subunit
MLALLALLVIASLTYMVGMAILEGQSRNFWQSLEWAAETISTTGYGRDAVWQHPLMVIFVVMLQFVGVFLIFLIFPIYLLPALEERFQGRLPRTPPPLQDAVLIYRYGPAVSTLVDELEKSGQATLIAESDSHLARRLIEDGHTVINTDLATDLFEHLRLDDIHAIVANGDDGENAALTLSARQIGFEGEILALAQEPHHRKPLTVAGANRVFTPRHILAAAVAARASDRISPRIVGAQALGRKLVVNEIKIAPTSSLVGKTLRELEIGRRTGVTVIGQWRRGTLVAPLDPDARLDADAILIAAGSHEGVEAFAEESAARGTRSHRPFFVAGHGEVGRTVAQMLTSVGEKVTTLDERDLDGVDIVGDIADHRVLEKCGLKDAQAVILAVGSDSATLFATLVVKEFAPAVPIIARVNDASNVERIHRAGADFALSISQVSGQLLAARLLGRETISVDPDLQVLKTALTRGFAGKNPAELRIRERTGASVIAIERDDKLTVDLGPDFAFADGDVVYACGSDAATRRYQEIFPPATTG